MVDKGFGTWSWVNVDVGSLVLGKGAGLGLVNPRPAIAIFTSAEEAMLAEIE